MAQDLAPPEQAPDGVASAASLRVLTKRRDFLAAAKARHTHQRGFVLQARQRRDGEPGGSAIRVGFTCSKKVGNAVARNRAKRRLREIARLELPQFGRSGWDYVLIGRREATAAQGFDALRDQLRRAIATIHDAA